MFIILVTYIKPLKMVDEYLAAHSQFLDQCYKDNYLIASGRRNPRTGGVIISHMKDRVQLESLLKTDPFCMHQIANYEIIEFTPTKFHPDFSIFMEV